jgi:hypothetical protein
MKLTEKQKLILTIIIPACFAVILVVVGFFIFYKKTSSFKNQITDTEKKTKDAEDKLVKMGELGEKLIKLRKESAEFETLLPTKEEAAYENFIDTLTKFCLEADVQLMNATYEQTKEKGPPGAPPKTPFENISYKLSVQGDFFHAIYFVYLLESYQRFIKVNKFALKPLTTSGAEKDTQLLTYNMDLTLTTYVYTQPQTQPQTKKK